MCWGTTRLCCRSAALLVADGACEVCGSKCGLSAIAMRPAIWLKKITNQKDMKFEENYFIHLVFTTQNRGEIFTSIYVRTQFWRYNLHVHPTSVLHTSIRGDIQTKLHCSIQQKFKMERQFAKAFSTSVRSFASAPGTFQRVRQSTIKRV